MTQRLIVNADDYGRSPGVSAGIREAHLKGLVTSTTALMNMPGVEDALRLAQRDCPHLGLGVHLVLTSGSPVLPLEQVSSLTGGKGAYPDLDGQLEHLRQLDLNEVRSEWHAQVGRFVEATGRAPDHLDSHHHFSYFTPELLRLMLELAGEYKCAIRQPVWARVEGTTNGMPREIYLQVLEFAPPLMRDFGCRYPDYFDATFYDETATLDNLIDILGHLPQGVTELMCHPGYADDVLVSGSSLVAASGYSRPRENELATLTHPSGLELVTEKGIERITFAELA
jgi:predicted glycoside hydrolase/deacetylase ChbG (UPF0249 family)